MDGENVTNLYRDVFPLIKICHLIKRTPIVNLGNLIKPGIFAMKARWQDFSITDTENRSTFVFCCMIA